MSIVPKFLRGNYVSYTEVNPVRQRVLALIDPPTFDPAKFEPAFVKYGHQHPVISFYQRTGEGRAAKISDFLTQAQWHQTQMYQHVYKPMQVEDQFSIALPAPLPIVVGVVVSRPKRDFTERDRTLLNLFRTHMVAAYELADRFSRMKHDADTTAAAVESMNVGLIRVRPDGTVSFFSAKARLWLARHFPAGDDRRLPDLLERWRLRMRDAFTRELSPAAAIPMRVESADEALEIRWKRVDDDDLLLMESHPRTLPLAPLQALGLTPREAEAVYWITEGKTNAEIGIILGMSARTAQKHLERAFKKLDVSSRTAAAMRARDIWKHA